MKEKNKLMDRDWAALYMGIYGIMIQIISYAIIYFLSIYIEAEYAASTIPTLILAWYMFPILALFPLTLATLQIRQRKAEGRAFKIPMAGFIVNALWALAFVAFLATGVEIW